MHCDSAGIYYEQDPPHTVSEWRNPKVLASALRAALEAFSLKEHDHTKTKKTDWPAYKVSNCKSVDDFERSYHCLDVTAVNEAELFYDASIALPGEDAITLHALLNPYGQNEEMGKKLLRLSELFLGWDRML
jgi:hypothetical protein